MNETLVIEEGQVWQAPSGYEVRILGVIDGWAMYRRKGCVPQIASVTAIRRDPQWQPINTGRGEA